MTRENIFAIRLGSPSQRRDQAGLTGSILFCRSSLFASDGRLVEEVERGGNEYAQKVTTIGRQMVTLRDNDGYGDLLVGDEHHQALPGSSPIVTIGGQTYTFQYRR